MTKNLEKADTVVKLTLAVSVIVFYATHVIHGPFARALTILSALTILIFILKFVYMRRTGAKDQR
jgi:hypothetical protein